MSKLPGVAEIKTWAEDGPDVCKHVQKPDDEEVLYPPNEEINSLISFIPRGDCRKIAIDAVVNAANSGLHAGGGICGCIHDCAGPELAAACHEIGGCPTGKAVVTPGFNLPSKYVIHAVGPVGEHPVELESAYKSTLDLIDGEKIRSVGLCCISTGIYGYPIKSATRVALKTTREWLEIAENRAKCDRIIFLVFLPNDVRVYQQYLPLYFPLPGDIEWETIKSVSDDDDSENDNEVFLELGNVYEEEEEFHEHKAEEIVEKNGEEKDEEKLIDIKPEEEKENTEEAKETPEQQK